MTRAVGNLIELPLDETIQRVVLHGDLRTLASASGRNRDHVPSFIVVREIDRVVREHCWRVVRREFRDHPPRRIVPPVGRQRPEVRRRYGINHPLETVQLTRDIVNVLDDDLLRCSSAEQRPIAHRPRGAIEAVIGGRVVLPLGRGCLVDLLPHDRGASHVVIFDARPGRIWRPHAGQIPERIVGQRIARAAGQQAFAQQPRCPRRTPLQVVRKVDTAGNPTVVLLPEPVPRIRVIPKGHRVPLRERDAQNQIELLIPGVARHGISVVSQRVDRNRCGRVAPRVVGRPGLETIGSRDFGDEARESAIGARDYRLMS